MNSRAKEANSHPPGLRMGAVSYLNTAPLVDDLATRLPDAHLEFNHPSRLADDLAAGRLDVALAPVIELARHPEWSIVSTACIATRGPVLSVKVLFRKPPRDVRTLALDEGSRTSAILAQVLLADMYDVRPNLSLLPVDADPNHSDADAVLVIGDRAIRTTAADYADVWDLGDRWTRWTELPFVFAVWAARPGVDLATLEVALNASRDAGRRELTRIAAEQAAKLELPYDLTLAYLRDHLHFHLGPGERRGLTRYFARAAALDLIPNTTTWDFNDRTLAH